MTNIKPILPGEMRQREEEARLPQGKPLRNLSEYNYVWDIQKQKNKGENDLPILPLLIPFVVLGGLLCLIYLLTL